MAHVANGEENTWWATVVRAAFEAELVRVKALELENGATYEEGQKGCRMMSTFCDKRGRTVGAVMIMKAGRSVMKA